MRKTRTADMKALTDRQKVLLLNKNLLYIALRGLEPDPKFTIGSRVRPIEFDYSAIGHSGWTYLDSIRREHLKEEGIVVRLNVLHDTPIGLSPWSYYVRFKNGQEIVFVEENLSKSKS